MSIFEFINRQKTPYYVFFQGIFVSAVPIITIHGFVRRRERYRICYWSNQCFIQTKKTINRCFDRGIIINIFYCFLFCIFSKFHRVIKG